MVRQSEGKMPPSDIEVEKAVLGSLLIESDAYYKVCNLISEESFYKFEHGLIFKAVKSVAESSKPIDLITITKKLKEFNELETIGGPYAITELTTKIAQAVNIEHYARIVQQKFIQRELIRIGIELTDQSFDECSDIEEIINNLKQKLNTIDEYSIGQNDGQSQKYIISEAIQEIEQDFEENKQGRSPGITTGLLDLNFATGGWRKTNLIILASRPAVGKTSLALHFAQAAARSGKWVNFYGLEMKAVDLMRIMISGESEVSRTAIRDGKLQDQDWDNINGSLRNIENLPIIWNDFAGLTVNHVKSITTKNRKKGKCDLIIIDYIQLLTPSDKKQNREQQISEISRSLKKITLSEDIPIIALAQLNREAEGGKPLLHHLRESGSLEQDGDIVIFPWVEEGRYLLSIAKNRRGKTGDFEIGRNEEMTKFFDMPKFPQHYEIKSINRTESSNTDDRPF